MPYYPHSQPYENRVPVRRQRLHLDGRLPNCVAPDILQPRRHHSLYPYHEDCVRQSVWELFGSGRRTVQS